MRLAVACLAACCCSCLPKGEGAEQPLSFSDDFERAELGAHYTKTGGSWRVLAGGLHTRGDHNQPLWLDVPLPRNVRVEFTTVSKSPAVDSKVEIFGDGVRHESGYILIFAGWQNSITAIARKDEHERTRQEVRRGGEMNRRYRWMLQRTDAKTLELFIDGVKLLEYVDERPLFGPGNNRLAFTSWESEVSYDDLKITPLP